MPPDVKWLVCGSDRIALQGQDLDVGRSRKCQIRVVEDSTSRRHASIVNREGRYLLVDHGSRNGTFVNGKRIQGAITLQHRDRIRIGKTDFLFSEDATALDLDTSVSSSNSFDNFSASASRTGTNILNALLYRSLAENNMETASRIVAGMAERIANSTQSGTLQGDELNATAPAILEYCRRVADPRWLCWLVGVYAKCEVVPPASVAACVRELAVELRMGETNALAAWLEAVRRAPASEVHEDAIRQLQLLRDELESAPRTI